MKLRHIPRGTWVFLYGKAYSSKDHALRETQPERKIQVRSQQHDNHGPTPKPATYLSEYVV